MLKKINKCFCYGLTSLLLFNSINTFAYVRDNAGIVETIPGQDENGNDLNPASEDQIPFLQNHIDKIAYCICINSDSIFKRTDIFSFQSNII